MPPSQGITHARPTQRILDDGRSTMADRRMADRRMADRRWPIDEWPIDDGRSTEWPIDDGRSTMPIDDGRSTNGRSTMADRRWTIYRFLSRNRASTNPSRYLNGARPVE